MSQVDVSRRRFLRFGGLLDRHLAKEPEPAEPGAGTPFVGAAPPPPWERAEPSAAGRKTRFAQIKKPYCLSYAGSVCTVCVERCPLPQAILPRNGRPIIDQSVCDGCGACAEACPAPTPAIVLIPYFDGGGA